jgi:hypothetical protein
VDWVQAQSHRISKAVHWHSDLAQTLRDTAIKASPVEWMTAGLESLLEEDIFGADEAFGAPAPDRPLRVLIMGAGMVGLMLANAFEEYGISAELAARQTVRRPHPSGIILYPNALKALRSMGVDLDEAPSTRSTVSRSPTSRAAAWTRSR